MRLHSLYNTNTFEGRVNDSEREQVIVSVSANCVNIFSKQNFQKPVYVVFFEEIVSAVTIDTNTTILQVFNKNSQEFAQIKITLLNPRAIELV